MNRIFLLAAVFFFICGSPLNAQEYFRTISIKSDSVTEGITRLMETLQLLGADATGESARNHRDSLDKAVRMELPGINNQPESYQSVLSRGPGARSMKLLSDLAWNNFIVSVDKKASVEVLRILQLYYKDEYFIQGNLAFAYEQMSRPDSAIAMIDRFKKLHPRGYTSLDIQRSLLTADDAAPRVSFPGTDSFQLWVTSKLYEYPAPVDSLRNALAAAILHRAGATRGKDKILGKLLVRFADLTAREKYYQLALPFYDMSLRYDESLVKLVENRRIVIASLEKSVTSTFQWASIVFAIPLLAFVIIIVGWIRNRST